MGDAAAIPRTGGALRLAVIERHDLTRAGVCAVLARHPSVRSVSSGSTLYDALTIADSGSVSVMVLSLDLPGVSPATVVARVLRSAPQLRIVALTAHPHPALRREALASGAMAYLTTGATQRDLLNALDDSFDESMTGARPIVDIESGDAKVTTRELEVLELMALAHSTRSIAAVLDIAEGTVKRHANNMYRKLRVGSRMHAVLEARRRGLLT